jgi:hypothetical protein
METRPALSAGLFFARRLPLVRTFGSGATRSAVTFWRSDIPARSAADVLLAAAKPMSLRHGLFVGLPPLPGSISFCSSPQRRMARGVEPYAPRRCV